MAEPPENLKQFLHHVADSLATTDTIDDVVHRLVVYREVRAGMADSNAGRTTDLDYILDRRAIQG